MAIAAAGILMAAVCTGCSSAGRTGADPAVANNQSLGSSPDPVPEGGSGIKRTGGMELLYADQFSVDYYDGGYAMAATSAMDLFCSLDGTDRITLSGTDASGWYIEEARSAMEDGRMLYAGKYNAPDYERILSGSCDLAVESTMIYHSPEVKEQLERLGIPVLVERSSYERHPLGRMEWLKLYGVLLDREEQANSCFAGQVKQLEPVMAQESTGKTVAFFYISSNGYVNVRKSGDYVAEMIDLAGGTYVPRGLTENENALSTMNMQMESFYAAARDADYIIYNSTIDGELDNLSQLLEKSSLLADFKAVKEGNVWCTEKSLFQETMGLGDMILDIHRILTEEEPEGLRYMHRLR